MKKILIIMFSLFILTSCFNKSNIYKEPEDNDNTPNQEIKQEYKEVKEEEKLEEISTEKLLKDLKTVEGGKNLKEKIEQISEFKTPREVDKLLILKSTVGQHTEVIEAKQKYCDKLQRDIYCLKFNAQFIVEELVDQDNKIITNVDDINVELDGEEIEFKHIFTKELNYEMNHLLRITQKGYIGYYKAFFSGKITPENNFRLKPKVEKYTFNQNINSSESLSYKTDNFEFVIEPNTFVYETGEEVLGNIDLYLFDIKSKDLSILTLKKFDRDTLSYLGRGIKNDSIAMVKAYKGNNELKINKPIKVLSNLNNINSEIEYTDFIPKNKVLTQEEKQEHNLPFIGNLDTNSGIWLTTDLKVLNKELDIEFTLN